MNGIFISYRREDSAWVSGLIRERLVARFGKDAIFTDVDSIPLGVNFKKYIDEQVGKCDIFLAVIGEKWLSVTDKDGRPRLKQRGDFVRLEIESALKREIPVIPLLVGEIAMPPANQLPKSLRELALRNATTIRPPPTFDSDVGRLIRGIEKHLGIQVKSERAAATKPVNEAGVAPFPGTVFQDTLKDGSKGPEMVVIPAGSFLMGSPADEEGHSESEIPQHRVTFPKPFALGKYAVTFTEYDRYCALTGREQPDDEGWGRENQPVIYVSRDDAVAYCEWLSAQTGKRYRLPSEAEWEYGARAATTTAYWWGNALGANRANCRGCGSKWDSEQTAPVGSFDANAFGLYDMLGNVQEWVQDCWHDSYAGAPTDGSAWEAGGDSSWPMVRGGSWHYYGLRSAARAMRSSSDDRDDDVGFRLAQDLD